MSELVAPLVLAGVLCFREFQHARAEADWARRQEALLRVAAPGFVIERQEPKREPAVRNPDEFIV